MVVFPSVWMDLTLVPNHQRLGALPLMVSGISVEHGSLGIISLLSTALFLS